MSSRVQGSLKNKIVATDLLEERAKCAFDQEELRVAVHGGPEEWKLQKGYFDLFEHPEI